MGEMRVAQTAGPARDAGNPPGTARLGPSQGACERPSSPPSRSLSTPTAMRFLPCRRRTR